LERKLEKKKKRKVEWTFVTVAGKIAGERQAVVRERRRLRKERRYKNPVWGGETSQRSGVSYIERNTKLLGEKSQLGDYLPGG